MGHTYRQPLLKTILRVHTCPRHPSFSSRMPSPWPSFTYEPGPTAEIERGRLWAEEDTFMMTFARRNLDDIRCASVLYLDYFLRWCALWKERGSMNRGISFFFCVLLLNRWKCTCRFSRYLVSYSFFFFFKRVRFSARRWRERWLVGWVTCVSRG